MQYGKVRIGISGWTYEPWRGVFYPEKLRQKDELHFAATNFPTIEINGTFYSLQRPVSYANWASETPDDFVFSVKATRYITHERKLRDIDVPLANFFASGLLKLGKKLGPILWQLPPSFKYDSGVLDLFFSRLPHTTDEAIRLGAEHERWMQGRAFLEAEEKLPIRHAIEIRHTSFVAPEFIQLLRKYNVTLVCADAVQWPRLMDVTTDFVYCRLHGSEELYASGYDDVSLERWARRVAAWARGEEPDDAQRACPDTWPPCERRDVYVYFDNDAKVRAPFDARELTSRVHDLLP